MKQKAMKLQAWFIIFTMVISMISTIVTENVSASEITEDTVYQTVALSTEGTQELTQEEYENYKTIASELLQNSNQTSVTVNDENTQKIYSLTENLEEKSDVILQEVVYDKTDDKPVLSSYSEIELVNLESKNNKSRPAMKSQV